MRITINGERVEISANRKTDPDNWNKISEKVTVRSEGVRIINTALATFRGKAEKYFSNLDIKDELISITQIIAELKDKTHNQMTLIKAYENYIQTIENLMGIDKWYKQSRNRIMRAVNV